MCYFQCAGSTTRAGLGFRRDVPVEPGVAAEVERLNDTKSAPCSMARAARWAWFDQVACSAQRRQQAELDAQVTRGSAEGGSRPAAPARFRVRPSPDAPSGGWVVRRRMRAARPM